MATGDSNYTEMLEVRVRAVEDRLAIFQLLATYGPGVDSMTGAAVAALWTEDGTYDAGGVEPFVGATAVGRVVDLDLHRDFVRNGCAHVMSLPHLVVDGDTAVATGYSTVFVKRGDRWVGERVSANRWEFVRTAVGWRVNRRVNRPLDGGSPPRELLGMAVRE